MSGHAPPEVLQARQEHGGATYALTLVMSVYPTEGSALLERLPDDKGTTYFVQNGEWRTTSPDDAPANKRSNRWIEFNGKRQTLTAWARELHMSAGTLHGRLAKWPLDRALKSEGEALS